MVRGGITLGQVVEEYGRAGCSMRWPQHGFSFEVMRRRDEGRELGIRLLTKRIVT
jgi:hypothetical protein